MKPPCLSYLTHSQLDQLRLVMTNESLLENDFSRAERRKQRLQNLLGVNLLAADIRSDLDSGVLLNCRNLC